MALLDPITVRIPELPAQSTLSLSDKVPVWVADDNKTRHASLTDLRTLILTGGTGAHPPVYIGGSMIYVVPEGIDPDEQIVAIPSLAGKDFILRREGRALIPLTEDDNEDAEYEILDGGGFRLLVDEDYLMPGMRFELDVFQLQGALPPETPTTGGGSLVSGVVPVTTNLTLNPTDHLNKLIQLRAGGTPVTITLFDIDDIPDNTIVCIEASILNTYQSKVQTQGGQFIYLRNASPTYLYLAPGESLWLYRGEDGYYDFNNFSQVYDQVGTIEAAYKVGLNRLLCDGSLLQRAQHPRLFEEILTYGSSVVSEATWNTASATVAGRTVDRPYRGCFSLGDGSDTFRLPDLMNMALRGLKNVGGSDDQRHVNIAGSYQRHEFPSHTHSFQRGESFTGSGGIGSGITGRGFANQETVSTTTAGIGAESRMDNIGVLWTIKE